ncbi:YciI family protein [Aestuariimicrobium sp. p3-SID1156]|uniref:YciI family protein n=1 Tax=Aestuariimicrobium sp. p3-SID1156 TaxID=2916038 RepID=UPI00223AB640|nr:YciI family protein [Aestuariimicrobium sp. p3-SID1156]MCT1460169.1 YciI family protein [Aestuariimicrobium sp. p3-SID1156]
MSFFAVTYTYSDDVDARDRLRPEHRAHLASLADSGELYASGPCPGTTPASALLIFRVDSAEKVEELLDADPFQKNGIVAQRSIVEWDPVIGQIR